MICHRLLRMLIPVSVKEAIYFIFIQSGTKLFNPKSGGNFFPPLKWHSGIAGP